MHVESTKIDTSAVSMSLTFHSCLELFYCICSLTISSNPVNLAKFPCYIICPAPHFENVCRSLPEHSSCNLFLPIRISITTSEYYEHHHPVKALPELTPPTKEWLFSTLLPKLCKWTSEINPELPLHVKKSVISMERYSKVHAQLKIKYADKFVKVRI